MGRIRNFIDRMRGREEPAEPMASATPVVGASGFLDEYISVDIPDTFYIRELAMYSVISLVANAVSQCEIVVYENGKKVKNNDWYTLNIQANINESASRFWHKVVEKMMTAGPEKGAFVFVHNGYLYCADDYNIKEKRPLKATGNLYDGVVLDTLVLNRTYTGKEIMLFKLENTQGNRIMTNAYTELDGLISTALSKYKSSNKQRWKFKVTAREAGTPEFQTEWQTKLKQSVQKYVNGDAQVFVEYEDRTLDPVFLGSGDKGGASMADDSVKLIDQVYKMVARAYHIPPGLITETGNYNISDLVDQFLTFVVDPIADMIGKTITATYGNFGKADIQKGNYFRVDTSRIKHFDIFSMASDIDKLISSGFATVNETRESADWDADHSEEWLDEHILTKNYLIGGQEHETENI